MSNETKTLPEAEAQPNHLGHVEDSADDGVTQPRSKIVRFYAHPWTQILLISIICFCLPGVSQNSFSRPSWTTVSAIFG